VPSFFCLFQKYFHIIPPLVCGEIEEMMAAQAEQDFRHVFSCVSDIRLLIRAGDQVADEFFLSVRISEEIGCEKILPVCFAGNGTGRPFGDTASESEAPVMSLHLPFQFFSGCGDGAQSGEITSFHMKTECVQVSEAGLADEKEISGMSDGRQHIHVLIVLAFCYFLERKALGFQVDTEHLVCRVP
jgi:hypothetical protein